MKKIFKICVITIIAISGKYAVHGTGNGLIDPMDKLNLENVARNIHLNNTIVRTNLDNFTTLERKKEAVIIMLSASDTSYATTIILNCSGFDEGTKEGCVKKAVITILNNDLRFTPENSIRAMIETGFVNKNWIDEKANAFLDKLKTKLQNARERETEKIESSIKHLNKVLSFEYFGY